VTAAGPAVVVGGASGIGAAVADRYRSARVDVVVWDRVGDPDIRCDITDPDQVGAAVAATIGRIGVPGEVTVTAGIGHSGRLADVDATEWDRVMAVNAKGVWLAMRGLAGTMAGDGADVGGGGAGVGGDGAGGSIVVISSVSARLVDRTMGLYCASKAALDMVVRVAAREWAPAVRVNAVAPGVTDTPMLGPAPREGAWLTGVAARTALGRIGRPEDIAEAVAAVHGMHWVTGQIIECDGGLSLYSPIDPTGRSRGNARR
jgi:NAD(P)-dependent dehydrogenase (short-subunit alcohol dehydrogenase family)